MAMLDLLGFVRLLIEREGKIGVQLVDEELMTIDLGATRAGWARHRVLPRAS